jgi:hypothetical protein
VPYLRQLIASLSLQRPRFVPTWDLWQTKWHSAIFFPTSLVFSCQYHSTLTPHAHISRREWTIEPLMAAVQRCSVILSRQMRYYPGICPGLTINTQNFSQYRQSLSWDLKPGSPGYKAEMLTTQLYIWWYQWTGCIITYIGHLQLKLMQEGTQNMVMSLSFHETQWPVPKLCVLPHYQPLNVTKEVRKKVLLFNTRHLNC